TDPDRAIAPFVEYISVRRQSIQPTTSSSPHTEPDRRDGPNLTLPLGMEPVPQAIGGEPTPLNFSSEVLQRLRLDVEQLSSSKGRSAQGQREALLHRLLDPAISVDDTALLLAVTPTAVVDFAE